MADRDIVELQVGEQHSVKLTGLGTAGYRWRPEHLDDGDVAEVRATDARDAGDAVGASADEVFEIRALKPGSTYVRFAQRRPWEEDGQPANEHVVELHVKPS
ncbi:MAG: protease inhibitor I42 family protein [Thermoleophilaceae bacterium]|nr:protease inhibitor I42 family protein [Thermoleophilaceae bacterium]